MRNRITKCNCGALIKAIDRYIAKADNDLQKEMSDAGYADAKKSVSAASDLEDELADALNEQTGNLAKALLAAGSLEGAAQIIESFFEEDETRDRIKDIFAKFYEDNVVKLSNTYMKETDGDLVVSELRERTSAWTQSWSEELSDKMQLSSEKQIGNMIQSAIDSGSDVAEFARKLTEDGIRNEEYRARATSITEMLRAHSVAQEEAIQQSPAASKKKWRHSGGAKIAPRQNHVAMDGQIVDKLDPFELVGADGNTYYPMYPRDSILPPGESISCHCIHQPVVDDDILGMTLEERQKLQQQIIDEDNELWEKELDANNKAKAGINEDTITMDWLKKKSKDGQIKYCGGKKKWALVQSGVVKNDADLHKIKTSTLQELRNDGIFITTEASLNHSTIGNFSNLRNPKKPAGGRNGGNMTGGGHSQENIDELSSRGINISIEKTYDNGVRIGGVENHNDSIKSIGNTGQSWFPEEWDTEKVMLAGTYTANVPAITEELTNKSGDVTGYRIFQKYDGVTVGVITDTEHNIKTVFPDELQREVGD